MLTCRLCGGEFPAGEMASNGKQKPSYCKFCYNLKRKLNKALRAGYFREYDRTNHKVNRLQNHERYLERERAKHTTDRTIRPDAVKAVNAVNNDLKSPNGVLVKLPCEVCGAGAQAHHEDYLKPLDVRWLCPVHHRQRHMELQAMMREDN